RVLILLAIFLLCSAPLVVAFVFLLLLPRPPLSTLFPYTTLFRSGVPAAHAFEGAAGARQDDRFLRDDRAAARAGRRGHGVRRDQDRKSTRLNSSHGSISYAVFCLKKKKKAVSSISVPRAAHRNAEHHVRDSSIASAGRTRGTHAPNAPGVTVHDGATATVARAVHV